MDFSSISPLLTIVASVIPPFLYVSFTTYRHKQAKKIQEDLKQEALDAEEQKLQKIADEAQSKVLEEVKVKVEYQAKLNAERTALMSSKRVKQESSCPPTIYNLMSKCIGELIQHNGSTFRVTSENGILSLKLHPNNSFTLFQVKFTQGVGIQCIGTVDYQGLYSSLNAAYEQMNKQCSTDEDVKRAYMALRTLENCAVSLDGVHYQIKRKDGLISLYRIGEYHISDISSLSIEQKFMNGSNKPTYSRYFSKELIGKDYYLSNFSKYFKLIPTRHPF